jgi:hypothetical protein
MAQIGSILHSSRTVGAKTLRLERDEFGKYFAVRKFGGRDRDRTGDPLLAKQVLSQLSYTPTAKVTLILKHSRARRNPFLRILVMWSELEATLQGGCDVSWRLGGTLGPLNKKFPE